MLKRYSTGVDSLGNNNGSESRFRTYKNCRTTRPAWNSDKPSVFRVLPGAHPEIPGQLDAFMLEDGAYGNWMFVVPQVLFPFGKNGTSFALQYGPDDANWRSDSPYCVLYDAIKDYAKLPDAPRSAIDLVESKNRDLRLIPAPSKNVIMAVIPYYRDGKDITIESRDYVELLSVSESSFLGLNRYLRNHWISGEKVDPIDPNGGLFLSLWNKEKCSPNIDEQYKIVLKGTFGYDLALTPTFPRIGSQYDGCAPHLSQQQMNEYLSMVRPIHEYVNYMSYDRQAELICHHAEAGDLPAWAVTYAFEHYPEWISQGVKLKAQPRRDAPVQGYAVQQPQVTYPQQPAYQPAPAYAGQTMYQQPSVSPQQVVQYAPQQLRQQYNQIQYTQSAPAVQGNRPVEGTAYVGNLPMELGVEAPKKPARNSFGADLQKQVLEAANNGMENDEAPF